MYILDVFFLQWKCTFYMNLHKKVSTGSTGFFKVIFLFKKCIKDYKYRDLNCNILLQGSYYIKQLYI